MVVGRELCLFLAVDATKIPAKQRANFIALAVRRAAPFPDPAHEVAWFGTQAGVWYWSRSRVLDLLGPQSLRVTRFLPESHFTGRPPDADGAQLLALAQGFEGRAWKGGRLATDRWWPDSPSLAEWTAFLRGAGLPTGAPPVALDAPVGDTAWVRQRQGPRIALDDADTWMRRGAIAAGAVACLAVGFEAGAGLRGMSDARRMVSAMDGLDEPLTRILDARTDAESEAHELHSLLLLRAPRGQLEMLAEIQRVMPTQDWRLVLWNQTASDQIEITVAMDRPDATAAVAALEGSPMFTDVSSSVNPASNRLVLRARILGTIAAAGPDDTAAITGAEG